MYRPRIDDRGFLLRAIELGAETVRANRGGPFGAVVVRDGVIVGEGANSVPISNDPTAHAEVMAIRAAGKNLATFVLRGTIIYASSEPCPMCLAAIYWARIDAVVYATGRDGAAAVGFDDAFLYDEFTAPPERRSLPLRQIELPEGRALFAEWRDKRDKVLY